MSSTSTTLIVNSKHMKDERLAISAQNVYAERREEKPMPDGPGVPEIIPPQSESSGGERLRRPDGERQRARRKRERGGRGEKTVLKNPFTGQKVEIENPQQLKAFLDQFEREARRGLAHNPFRGLSEEELKNQYYAISRLEARFSQEGSFGAREGLAEKARMFHQVMMEELERRGTDLNELFKKAVAQAAEEGTPIRSIGAATIADEYTDVVLRNIVGEINSEIARAGENQPLRSRFIADQLERIRSRRDAEPTSVDEAQRLLQSLNEFAEESERQREEEGGYGRRRIDPRDVGEESSLRREEAAAFVRARYTTDEVGRIAQGVQTAITNGEATSAYFRGKITELANYRRSIQGQSDRQRESDEAALLLRDVRDLGVALADRKASAIAETTTSMTSFYGEQKLTGETKRELVNLFLASIQVDEQGRLTPDADEATKEFELRFNRLFAGADASPTDEWREALGQIGGMEVGEFISTLQSAATERTSFKLDRRLAQWEKDKLNEKVRELKEEQKVREFLHSISFYVNQMFGVEEVNKAMGQFKAEDASFAFSKRGVAQALRIYDRTMFEVAAKHGGYLPYEAMVQQHGKSGEVETLVREQMKKAVEAGVLPRDMAEWEISRAISLARGMGIATGRFFEVAAQAGISQQTPLDSWWANDIIKKMAFFKQIARYNIGREANKMLFYKLEGSAPVWSTKELTEVKDAEIGKYIRYGLMENEEDDRYISMANPFNIGSIFSQTQWRYQMESMHNSGAIAALLNGYADNPIIGLGMWTEKLKRALRGQNEKIKPDEAVKLIAKQLDLAAEVAPLKFFHNLPWLERSVLERHYASHLPSGYRDMNTDDKLKARGDLVKEMEGDFTALSLVEEEFIKRRTEAYKTYLGQKKAWIDRGSPKGEEPEHPDLFSEQWRSLSFNIFPEGQRESVKALAGHITEEFKKPEHFNRLINDLKDKQWRVPYVLGTDDMPFELYDWVATGGSTFKRRWGDLESASKAGDLYEQLIQQLPKARDQENIVKMLDGIYQTLRAHDEGVAREVMFRTTEGIIKFFKKDWRARLPLGVGMFIGAVGGKASYAQAGLNRSQMAWDETQSYAFIHKVRSANLIEEHHVAKLEKLTGSRSLQVGYDVGRSLSVILLGALAFYIAMRALKEER